MIRGYETDGNGDWLDGTGVVHEGPHTKVYRNEVNRRLLLADPLGADAVRDALQKIANELVEGTFPWK